MHTGQIPIQRGSFLRRKGGARVALLSGAAASAPVPSRRARCRTGMAHRPALEHPWAASATSLPLPAGSLPLYKTISSGRSKLGVVYYKLLLTPGIGQADQRSGSASARGGWCVPPGQQPTENYPAFSP